jgi:hypothetical protein
MYVCISYLAHSVLPIFLPWSQSYDFDLQRQRCKFFTINSKVVGLAPGKSDDSLYQRKIGTKRKWTRLES